MEERILEDASVEIWTSDYGFAKAIGPFGPEDFPKERVFCNTFAQEMIVLSEPDINGRCLIYKFKLDEFLDLTRKLNLS